MRKAMAALLVIGSLGLIGCNDKPKEDVSAAPPPPIEPAPAPAPSAYPMAAPAPVAVEPVYAPAPVTSTGARSYTVKKGDTLYGIARREYGDASRVKDILAANPGINPNVIKVGQKLNLP